MGKSAPAAPDFTGAAQQTSDAAARLNRPNQTNAFGSSTTYETGPDGQVQMRQGFGGPLAGLATGLQQQAADMGGPLDWAQFGQVGTGDEARQQAIDAAYNQSTSRLNPMWQQREEAERARLLNAGVPESSELFRNTMQGFNQQRNDAFQGALNSAIGQGTAAGQAVFGQNLQARQQQLSEALRRRGMPMQELAQLSGFLAQPGVNQVAGPNLLGAAQAGADYGLRAWDAQNRADADALGGLLGILGSVGGAAVSDERAKEDVQRLALEVLPGVPLATWRYRPGYGAPGRHVGVIAQDLEAAGAGRFVVTGPDGVKRVKYAQLVEATNAGPE